MRAALLAILLLLGLPAVSSASSVTRTGDVLVFTASPGESAGLRVYARDGRIHFAESVPNGGTYGFAPSSGPVAGAGCEQRGAEAACPQQGVQTVRASLGDGVDELRVMPDPGGGIAAWSLPVPLEVDLGDGDDNYQYDATPRSPLVIFGGAGDDELKDGTAADVLDGGSGDDSMSSSGGADRLVGGDGDDTFSGPGPGATVSCGAGADGVFTTELGAKLGDGCPPSFKLLAAKGSTRFPFLRLRFGRASGPATATASMREDTPGAFKRFKLIPGRTTTVTWRLKAYAKELKRGRCTGPKVVIALSEDAEGNSYQPLVGLYLRLRRGRVSYVRPSDRARFRCRSPRRPSRAPRSGPR